jgi:hypothetical protein
VGFNKRHVSAEILSPIIDDVNELEKYFKNADALFFSDKLSLEIYYLFVAKKSYRHLIKKVKKYGH